MLWYTQLLIHAVLVVCLIRKPDGRRYFEAWIAARLLFDLVQMVAERTGHLDVSTTVWYIGTVATVLLLAPTLHEAAAGTSRHRHILFTWTCLSMGAAWIRFFPYTGRAVVIIDAAASIAWIADKMLSERENVQTEL